MSGSSMLSAIMSGSLRQLGTQNVGGAITCCRSIGDYKNPPNYDHVKLPHGDRRKLPLLYKVPQIFPGTGKPPKYTKRLIDIRGPELVHNKLVHKQYGIQALGGGNLRHGHIESLRLNVNRKLDFNKAFAIWRIDCPWKPITKKGQGTRMGGGKGSIHHYVTPVKANRIIMEVGGKIEYEEIERILWISAQKMPFKARVVNQQMLEKEEAENERIAKLNINPFDFKYAADNNLLGCQQYISKYDYIWHNKYR